jgi:radical SAM protein with 4Fe4S-binding SPASM domain
VTVHIPVRTNRVDRAFGQNEDPFELLQPAFDHFCNLSERWLVETYIPWAEHHPAIRQLAKNVHVVHRGCRAGRDRLTISPQGWISPCVCLDVSAAYIGNIRKDSLLDCFNHSPVCEMLRRPEAHGLCRGCPSLGRCGGGCRAAAFAFTGRLNGQDKSCPIWKVRTTKGKSGGVHR